MAHRSLDRDTKKMDFVATVQKLRETHTFSLKPDTTLPACPLCHAPALQVDGYRFQTPGEITHNCLCVADRYAEYDLAIRKTHQQFLHDTRKAEQRKGAMSDLDKQLRQASPLYARMDMDTYEGYPQFLRDNPFVWAYIYGSPGAGKTHLGIAHLKRLSREFGLSTAYACFPEYLREIREAVRYNRPIPDFYRNVEALLLDDIGKNRPTEFIYEEYYSLVEYRNRMHCPEEGIYRITLFTSNVKPILAADTIYKLPDGFDTWDADDKTDVDNAIKSLASRMGRDFVLPLKERPDRRFKATQQQYERRA